MTKDVKNLLLTSQNIYRTRNYIISITQGITLAKQVFLFGLRYIPDKIILEHGCLAPYLEQLLSHNPEDCAPERLGHRILEDIMDQTIPKWIEVNLIEKNNIYGQNIAVTIEDRQPNWQDDDLLKRLTPLF